MHIDEHFQLKAKEAVDKKGAIGPDVDLSTFDSAPLTHKKMEDEDLRNLPEEERNQLLMAGLDVTINTITERYILQNSKNIMLIDQSGVVVSADEYLINLFGLPSLVNHKYLTTIQSDQYRSDDYNLLKSKSKPVRMLAEELITKGSSQARFSIAGKEYQVISKPIPELKWTAILVVE